MGSHTLQWALRYLKAGLSIIPINPKSKVPALDSWKEFQNRKPTEKEVVKWFSNVSNANIGIVTGSVSNVGVLDADGPIGNAWIQEKRLTSPIVARSGKGRHLYFKWTNGLRNSASKLADNVDIRGEGGYVLAPPSIHPNGQRYCWMKPFTNLRYLPSLPDSCVVALTPTATSAVVDSEDRLAHKLEQLKNGHVHNTLVSILGQLRRDRYSMRDAIALLKPYAYENGHPFEGLEAKVEEIWNRYEPAPERSFINNSQLIIHSPTNPDSIKQFESTFSGLGQTVIRSGFQNLDKMFDGGLKTSRLFTIAARTGTGKTNWLIALTRNLCETGRSVLFFSTEMPYTEIWSRYRATLSNPESFSRHKLYICDSFAPSVERVEEAINQVKPDIFIFDHINHISEEYREISTFMQGLNYLRRKFDCIGIVAAQLNRQADWVDVKTHEKVTPRMSMIKGSGTIEQASSRVLLLSETKVLPEYTEIVGNIDKNDKGTKGLVYFGLFNNPWRIEELKQ